MAESNAALMEAAFSAVNRRDADALAALCTPDVEFRPIITSLTEETYRGPEGLRRWVAEIARRFPDGHATAERLDDRGDAAIVSGVTRGAGLTFRWHMTAHIEGGRIAAWTFHPTREHAERAAET